MPTYTVDGITWNYTLSGSDATIGTGSNSNGNGTTSGTAINGAITIPDTVDGYTVKAIGLWSFRGCGNITSVIIPDTVLSIGESAFSICSGITEITFGNSITSLGNMVFYACSKILSISLPNTLTTMGTNCFQTNRALTSVTIPAAVTTIGSQAFYYCTGLTSVIIEDYSGLHTLGYNVFMGCELLTSINIPDSVTSIGSNCFLTTPANLVIAMNTKTIDGTTYTSPTTGDISFFGNSSVTLVVPPPPPPPPQPPLTLVSGKVPNWLQPKSGQYTATMGGYESQFPAWCSPTSAANQLGHLVDHGGVTQPTHINDGTDAGNDSPFALAASTIAWDSGYGWGDYLLDGPTYRGQITISGFVTDFGWYMNTNNLGPLGAGAGSAVGSTLQNIYTGMVDFYQQVGYTNMVGMVYHFNGSIQNFGVDPAYWTANGHNAGAGVSADYTITLNTIKHEIDNNRTVMACFNGWSITPAGHADLTGMSSNEDETGIYQTLGEFQPEGPHGEQFNTPSTEGGNIESYNAGLGHTVLIVGYIPAGGAEDPTGSTEWLVVRDNYTTTHKNVIIPFANLSNLLATVYVNHTTATYNAITIGGADYSPTTQDTEIRQYPPDYVDTNTHAIVRVGQTYTSDQDIYYNFSKSLKETMTITGQVYGNGVYEFEGNTGYSYRNTTSFTGAFMTNKSGDWMCNRGGAGNTNNSVYPPNGNYKQYCRITMPTPIKLKKVFIRYTDQGNAEVYIYGTNSTTTNSDVGLTAVFRSWTGSSPDTKMVLDTNYTWEATGANSATRDYLANNDTYYKYYWVFVNGTGGITHHVFEDIHLYGSEIMFVPTPVTFTNNILTIENSIDENDTDVVSFVLPAGEEMASLNVTNFVGTGTISYTISATGATDITGTISAIGDKLLANNVLLASTGVDITYTLRLTSSAAITYTIVGTKNVDYTVVNSVNIRTIYDTAGPFTDGQDGILENSGAKIEFFLGTTGTSYLPFRNNQSYYYPLFDSGTTVPNAFVGVTGDPSNPPNRFPVIGTVMSDQTDSEGNLHANWLVFHPSVLMDDPNVFRMRISAMQYNTIIGYTLFYGATSVSSCSFKFTTNTETHLAQTTVNTASSTPSTGWTYVGTEDQYTNVHKYTKNDINIEGNDYIDIRIDGAGNFGSDACVLKILLMIQESSPLTFSNNILTIENSIDENDTDVVSFVLPAGEEMASLNVTNFVGTGTISYTISATGATDITGTVSANGDNLLADNMLVANAGADITYTLTMTASAGITYTIVGTKQGDYDQGFVEREYPPAWVRQYILDNTANKATNSEWTGTDASFTVDDANEEYGQGTYTFSCSSKRNDGGATDDRFNMTNAFDGDFSTYSSSWLRGWYSISSTSLTNNNNRIGSWVDLEDEIAGGNEASPALTVEFPESFQPTKFKFWGNSLQSPTPQILYGYDETNSRYDRLHVSTDTFGSTTVESYEYNITQTTPKSYKKYAITSGNSEFIIWPEIRLWGIPELQVTNTYFVNNILTIENSISQNDTDAVSFVLPVGDEIDQLVVTNFVGTGTITYTIITGTTTVKTGTFTSTGTNLLLDTPLTAGGSTYKVVLTADAVITYTIIGTKMADLATKVISYGDWGTEATGETYRTETKVYDGGADNYGNSVAIYGDYMMVGKPTEQNTGNRGSVYIYKRDNINGWPATHMTKLEISGGDQSEFFGSSIAINANHMVVGSIYDGTGSATVFEHNGSGGWTEIIKLKPSIEGNMTQFGTKVEISGNYIVVGSLADSSSPYGSAYIYELSGGTWGTEVSGQTYRTETKKIYPSIGTLYDRFGSSIAIHGNYIIIGAYSEDSDGTDQSNNIPNTDSNTGAAYLFERDNSTGWPSTETKFLKSPTPVVNGNFGIAVSINENYIVICEKGVNAAYIYERDSTTGWPDIPTKQITAGDASAAEFGTSVAMNENIIVIGATTSKSAYIFDKDPSTGWPDTATSKLLPLVDTTEFGWSAAIHENVIVIGARQGYKAFVFEQQEIITYIPTTFTFSNNMLTIDNVTSTTDTDVIDFVLPAGYNIPELNVTNFNGTGNVSYTLTTGGNAIVSGTFSAISSNLLQSGFPIFALSTDVTYELTITADALIGYSIVGTRGVTNVDNYSTTHFFISGFTEQQLIDSGIWNADSNANRFNSTYNDGFLDISGNVKVTDNILMETGDIDLHSHTFTDPHVFTADVGINNRLFVVGDVSMGDASLNIVGDISINGVMSVGSYKPASISTTALIPGSGYSTANSITTLTEDIAYIKKIQFNGDISLNSTMTQAGYYATIDTLTYPLDFTTDSKMVAGTNTSHFGSSEKPVRINNTGNVILTINSSKNMAYSVDYGENWSTYNTDVIAVNVSGDGNYICVVTTSNIYISSDTGGTWSNPAGFSTTAGHAVSDTCLSYDGQYIFVMGGIEGSKTAVRSTNYGASFANAGYTLERGYNNYVTRASAAISDTGEYIMVSTENSVQHIAPGDSNRPGNAVYASSNYGANFTLQNPTIFDWLKISHSVMSHDGQYQLAHAKTGRGSYNFGATWGRSAGSGLSGSFSKYAYTICRSHANVHISANDTDPNMFISIDGGSTFNIMSNTNMNTVVGATYIKYQFTANADGSLIYFTTNDGRVGRLHVPGIGDWVPPVFGNTDATTYFGANTTLKANTGIEFPDGTTLHRSNKEADGTTFKASTFNNMTVIGEFSSPAAVVTSDYRIKNNVETLDETHIVDNLRPVKYKQTQTGKNDIGFLAHELQEHYPELVEGEKDGDKMQSVNYSGLLPILINEVQQLKKQIAETRARIHSETS